jgi:hypothetical protein
MPKTELPFAKRQDRKQLLQRRKQSETAPAADDRQCLRCFLDLTWAPHKSEGAKLTSLIKSWFLRAPFGNYLDGLNQQPVPACWRLIGAIMREPLRMSCQSNGSLLAARKYERSERTCRAQERCHRCPGGRHSYSPKAGVPESAYRCVGPAWSSSSGRSSVGSRFERASSFWEH